MRSTNLQFQEVILLRKNRFILYFCCAADAKQLLLR